MNGILLIDKPKGWTSFDVVNYVRKMARQAALVESYKVESRKSNQPLDFETFKSSTRLSKVKVGHTGTLDPLATGLLVLVVGKEYTRRAGEFSKLDKTYEVTMRLGQTSSTGDEEGDKTAVSDQQPNRKDLEAALAQFTGQIMQTPPAYSAMKVGGVRAYKLARRGETVDLAARPVTVYSNQLTSYDYPLVKFTAQVSSGTYIRSLVEDLGAALGCGAYMADLRRRKVGRFDISAAHGVKDASLLDNLLDL